MNIQRITVTRNWLNHSFPVEKINTPLGAVAAVSAAAAAAAAAVVALLTLMRNAATRSKEKMITVTMIHAYP